MVTDSINLLCFAILVIITAGAASASASFLIFSFRFSILLMQVDVCASNNLWLTSKLLEATITYSKNL